MTKLQIRQIYDPIEALELAKPVVEKFVLPTFSEEGRKIFPEILAKDIVKNFSDPEVEAFGIRINQKLVGYIAAKNAHILELFVLADQQRSGIGQLLLNFIEQRVKAQNLSQLTVRASLNAVPFYQKCGFEASAEPQEINGIRFQPMQKLL